MACRWTSGLLLLLLSLPSSSRFVIFPREPSTPLAVGVSHLAVHFAAALVPPFCALPRGVAESVGQSDQLATGVASSSAAGSANEDRLLSEECVEEDSHDRTAMLAVSSRGFTAFPARPWSRLGTFSNGDRDAMATGAALAPGPSERCTHTADEEAREVIRIGEPPRIWIGAAACAVLRRSGTLSVR